MNLFNALIRHYEIITHDTYVNKGVHSTKGQLLTKLCLAKIEARRSRTISCDLQYLKRFSICLRLQVVQYYENFLPTTRFRFSHQLKGTLMQI